MSVKVYVAAPFQDAPMVREVHERLVALGATYTSTWAESAVGEEDFSKFTPTQLARIADSNDEDVRRSDIVLVMARHGAGGESFCEARLAIDLGRRVLWVGRRILSAWRPGVIRCEDLDEALWYVRGAVAGSGVGRRVAVPGGLW